MMLFNINAVQKLTEKLQFEDDVDLQGLLVQLQQMVGLKDSPDYSNEYPKFIKIIDEYISVLERNNKILVKDSSIYDNIYRNFTEKWSIIAEEDGPLCSYTPLYDLFLIRKEEKEVKIPKNSVILGEYFKIGAPRNRGTYKYPLVAQSLLRGDHYQIHKIDDEIKVFGKKGKLVTEYSDELSSVLLDIWKLDYPENVVLNAIFDGGKLHIFDIFLWDDMDSVFNMPLKKRFELINSIRWGATIGPMEYQVIKSENELNQLHGKKFMLRWLHEKVNIPAPFWFIFDADAYNNKKESVEEMPKTEEACKNDLEEYDKFFKCDGEYVVQDDEPCKFVFTSFTDNGKPLVGILSFENPSNREKLINITVDKAPRSWAEGVSGELILGIVADFHKDWEQYHELFVIAGKSSGHYAFTTYLEIKSGFGRDTIEPNLPCICGDRLNPGAFTRYINYNPLALEALSKTDFAKYLPQNWNDTMDEYEDNPIIDNTSI